MKIFEVFDEEQTSVYQMKLQSKVLDYLTSVTAIGAETIHVNQLINAFSKHSIDIREEQIDDLLMDTGFEKQGDKIVRTGSDEMEEPDLTDKKSDQMANDAEKEDDMRDQKVSNMAQNQLAKDN